MRLDLTGVPPFHRSVYAVVRNIAPGRTRSYGEVAALCGDRHAARQSLDALTHASRFLRGELGRKIDLRYTPELIFVEDRSAERAIELAKTLRDAAQRWTPKESE